MSEIFFTADLHIGHANILHHQPNRPFASESDTTLHDQWIEDLWKRTVSKKDIIFILGDLTFLKSEQARLLLQRLPGQKFLIEGNHDGSIRSYKNYFKRYEVILDMTIKPTLYPQIDELVMLSMCHYPMVSWNHKPYGSIMLHGHCHGKLDDYNSNSADLRFDVGIDGQLAQRYGGFITMRQIYDQAKAKTNEEDFRAYAQSCYRKDTLYPTQRHLYIRNGYIWNGRRL